MMYKLPEPIAHIHNAGQGGLWWNRSVDENGEYKTDDVQLFTASQMQAAYAAGLAKQNDMLKMLAQRARSFPSYPIGSHITEVFAAVGETPPSPGAKP